MSASPQFTPESVNTDLPHSAIGANSHVTIDVGGHIIAVPKSLSIDQMEAVARHYFQQVVQGGQKTPVETKEGVIAPGAKFNVATRALAGAANADNPKRPKIFDRLAQRSALPVPSGYALVQSSDKGLHHLPQHQLEQARAIDPGVRVINGASQE